MKSLTSVTYGLSSSVANEVQHCCQSLFMTMLWTLDYGDLCKTFNAVKTF